VATSTYRTWVAAGRHWQLAQPIADMVAVARRHNIPVLGTIGDESHLTAGEPEDHTPFSVTAWPVPQPGWVCAADLADVGGLGAAILRDARAGRLPWLKYMNVAGKHYEHGDSFARGAPSPDVHIHLSCRSDWITRSIGDYDPLAPREADVELTDRLKTYRNGEKTVADVLLDVQDGVFNKLPALATALADFRAEVKADLANRPTPTIDLAALAEELRQHLPTPREVAAALIEQLRPHG
jgi:hypothetical protein